MKITKYTTHKQYMMITAESKTTENADILADMSLSSMTTSAGLFTTMDTPKWTPATVQLDRRAEPWVLNPNPTRPPEIRVLTMWPQPPSWTIIPTTMSQLNSQVPWAMVNYLCFTITVTSSQLAGNLLAASPMSIAISTTKGWLMITCYNVIGL